MPIDTKQKARADWGEGFLLQIRGQHLSTNPTDDAVYIPFILPKRSQPWGRPDYKSSR